MAKHILLVEDNSAELKLLASSLKAGIHRTSDVGVLTAKNVQEAVDLVLQHGSDILVVVCDLDLGPQPPKYAQPVQKYCDSVKIERLNEELAGYVLSRWVSSIHETCKLFAMTRYPGEVKASIRQWFTTNGSLPNGLDEGVFDKHSQWPLLRHIVLKTSGLSPQVKVFIIHGHDDVAVNELNDYALTLNWETEIVAKKSWSNESWIQQIEAAADRAQLAWVLATEDEWGIPIKARLPPGRRPRPNVLLEAGYVLGLFGRRNHRVVIFEKGEVEFPSDIAELPRVRFSDSIHEPSVIDRIRLEIGMWL